MAGQEWRECTDPGRMVQLLRGRLSPRELRLFACAVNRLLPPPTAPAEAAERERAVRVAEAFADGLAGAGELAAVLRCSAGDSFWPVAHPDAFEAAEFAAAEDQLAGRQEEVAGLLRDIAGDPFCPARVEPGWRTRDVVAVARHVYQERSFGDLPVLADALEEAGCTDEDILGHLRGPGPHAAGCWALDLTLGLGWAWRPLSFAPTGVRI